MRSFSARMIAWQQRHGRHDLPWQNTRDPYAIWLSEIMLQQTQVTAVVPYYRRFLRRFPNLRALAAAPVDEVLALWSGLGYYSRARNLHQAALQIARQHAGRFPRSMDDVQELPGVGRSTAAAICVFAYGANHAILDGNVKRVLARHTGERGYPGEPRVTEVLWRKADALLPKKQIEAYTQGLMDLGATLCTRRKPRCAECPVRSDCVALARGLTDKLPARKPKKALPQRATTMLLLRHAGEIMLEKRPPRGIWGGLWSLPEITNDENAVAACRTRYGVRVKVAETLAVIAHGFTHFRLAITPQTVRVTHAPPRAVASETMWLTPEAALTAAIPTPVRRILLSI